MEHLWLAAGLLAAFFQALRLAALKELNQYLSTLATTYVRVLFGLPLLAVYLASVLYVTGQTLPALNGRFLAFSTVAAVTQFLGTAVLVRMFQSGNFAVGTMLAKTDVVLTAIIGSVFFSEVISLAGWLAILVTVAGVMIATTGRLPPWPGGSAGAGLWADALLGRQTRLGLTVGLIFAVSYLSLREAIVALDPAASPLLRSAVAATGMTALSFLILGVWLLASERGIFRGMRGHMLLCAILGGTSALGTVFWFLATALSNASYVAAVGQVQIIFTLALSRYWFREPIRFIECVGMVVILAGIVLFRAV